MKLAEILATLKQAEPALRPRGVMHAGVFGSVARGEEDSGSDVDIVIDFEPDARVTIYDYVSIKDAIASLFDTKVDVVDRQGLKPHLRLPVARDVIYAF